MDLVGGDTSSTKKVHLPQHYFFAIVSALPPGISVSQYRLSILTSTINYNFAYKRVTVRRLISRRLVPWHFIRYWQELKNKVRERVDQFQAPAEAKAAA